MVREVQESYLENDPQGVNPILRELFDGIRDLKTAFGGGGFVPTGGMVPYGGGTVPVGFLECDGAAVSRTTYKSLFDVIGTTYGAGDGSTTFNVPNTRDRFIYSGTFAQRGNTGGASTHAHTVGSQASSAAGAGNSYWPFSASSSTENHLPPHIRFPMLIKT